MAGRPNRTPDRMIGDLHDRVDVVDRLLGLDLRHQKAGMIARRSPNSGHVLGTSHEGHRDGLHVLCDQRDDALKVFGRGCGKAQGVAGDGHARLALHVATRHHDGLDGLIALGSHSKGDPAITEDDGVTDGQGAEAW